MSRGATQLPAQHRLTPEPHTRMVQAQASARFRLNQHAEPKMEERR